MPCPAKYRSAQRLSCDSPNLIMLSEPQPSLEGPASKAVNEFDKDLKPQQLQGVVYPQEANVAITDQLDVQGCLSYSSKKQPRRASSN